MQVHSTLLLPALMKAKTYLYHPVYIYIKLYQIAN